MKRILAQCIKELVQFRRDRLTLGLAFILPLLTLFIFGFAIRLEAKNIPLYVQDFDRSNLSQTYIDRLFATNQFVPIPWTDSRAEQSPERFIDEGIAKAVVIIPPNFSRNIKSRKPSTVQTLVDGTDVNNARVIKNSIQATTRFFLSNDTDTGIQTNNLVAAHVRLWFNPGRQESFYIVPGVYAVVLWIFPSLLAAIAMVREKEKGTILQVYASSLTAAELILGKALAYLVVGLCEALVVIGLGSLTFWVGFAGDPTPFAIGTTLFLADAVLFGLLLGIRTSNQNAAVQGVSLVGFITALLLSGFIYPLSNIPFPLSLVPNIIPARYYIIISRDAFVRGIGWSSVWFDELILIVIGLILFNVARHALSRMQLPD
ncbi:ABC transporter permease [Pseudanabaena sp. PCC 6802]|uniref:ABC transporter permease n=1 Tax=Pseudanabaena sp. PCC 6802 TaxID=118173 RepID=UPI0003464620|nr:ABC transporter permease [Pseudanabaena sp. PCC 6802]